jgi:hypothetical protein
LHAALIVETAGLAADGATISGMTAKERLLQEAPRWSEAQATAALRVVEAQRELVEYFDAEAKMTPSELKVREDQRAEANARALIREEPW